MARLKEDMKAAMKAKDKERLDAIRLINAAIKQVSCGPKVKRPSWHDALAPSMCVRLD